MSFTDESFTIGLHWCGRFVDVVWHCVTNRKGSQLSLWVLNISEHCRQYFMGFPVSQLIFANGSRRSCTDRSILPRLSHSSIYQRIWQWKILKMGEHLMKLMHSWHLLDLEANDHIFMCDSIYAIARISYGNSVCLSVCPSVCLSHGWISQKRLKLGSRNFHRTVAPSL